MMSQHSARPAIERRELDPDPDTEEFVTTLLDAVQEARPRQPSPPETPLYEAIETEALTSLVGHADADSPLVVTAVIADCDVVIDSRGTVLARYRDGSTSDERVPSDLIARLD